MMQGMPLLTEAANILRPQLMRTRNREKLQLPSSWVKLFMDFLPSTYACGYDGGAHEMPKGSPGAALEQHICMSENNCLEGGA